MNFGIRVGDDTLEQKIQTSLISLEGVVSSIIFKNDQNGYVVCEVDLADSQIIMVGTMPYLIPGESIVARGYYVTHTVYGQQFKVEEYERALPKTAEAIENFLGSGAIRGIGQVLAKRIVDMFGEQTLTIIENQPEKLQSVKGITRKKAEEIGSFVNFQMGIKKVIEYFAIYQLPPHYAVRAYKLYGVNTIEILKENPYLLCQPDIGVEFSIADGIAKQMGLDMTQYHRIRAAVLFCLNHNLSNGHTYLPKYRLCTVAMGLLEQEDEAIINEAMDAMFSDGDIIILEDEDRECVFLTHLYLAENYVAMRIAQLCDVETDVALDVESYISQIEQELGISYAQMQRLAIQKAVKRRLMILTGGPGTGKTTTVNAMIQLFQKMEKNVVLTAPTGRAAQRLSQLCGFEAKTIHRLLEAVLRNGSLDFSRNEKKPLNADVVIVDECSMVDILLMESLFRAIKPTASVILVGDYHQLPSVGPGNVLKDMIQSDCVDIIELDEIFRQAAQSLIVVNAHAIKDGQYPDLTIKDNDFFFLNAQDEQHAMDTIVGLVSRRLPKAYGLDKIDDIQVISPTKLGLLGTKNLNVMLQAALNHAEGIKQKRIGDTLYQVGDKVMQTKNNYDIEWTKIDDGTIGSGIFNGDIGRVVEIYPKEGMMGILFDDKLVGYPFELLDDVDLAYAITVHKSQGSEFKAVVMPLYRCPRQLMTREILYTAFTRARELLIIVGDSKTVKYMVDNKRHSSRYSMLKTMIQTGVYNHEED